MRRPTHRKPTTPGEFLTEEFLKPMGLTQADLAAHLHWTTTKVNQIAVGKRAVTPETALTLGEAFNVSAEFWLNAQRACDLWEAAQVHQPVKAITAASFKKLPGASSAGKRKPGKKSNARQKRMA